ncbi:PD-(D/E)XK nuclease family protein [Puia dinghuensis]|uniref:Uncharacterized protein n=1 Tax=Puia dinghuensis TaxID=1792502 RepID=A0A8J2UC15_9BACT|nr:PD-(D/E)XK nuclease family protein [Puia dinghuensis]GGA96333.1 hypothetical protein GCM10011511_19540 [Puia dinghuensis]
MKGKTAEDHRKTKNICEAMTMQDKRTDFLVKLLRCGSNEKRKRHEDFITLVLEEFFIDNFIILQSFLMEFFNIETNCNTKVNIKSHCSGKNSIYDLRITDSNLFYLIIELKVAATTDPNQLEKYLSNLENNPTAKKALCLISPRHNVNIEKTKISFKAMTWSEFVSFLEKNICANNKCSVDRFLELAKELDLDCRLTKSRKAWKCPECGLQISGYGIYRHQRSACFRNRREIRKEFYERGNKQIEDFTREYKKVEEKMARLESEIEKTPKIQQKSYSDIYELTDQINKALPKEWILYFLFRIRYHFSNSVFNEYIQVFRKRLTLQGVLSFEHPSGNLLDEINSHVYFGSTRSMHNIIEELRMI